MRILLFSLALTCAFATGSTSAQSEADRRAVSYETYEEADKAMGNAYKVIIARLEGEERAAFVKAQRAWIAWRDAEAESEAYPLKVSNDYGAFLADSKRNLTIERLANFLKIEANTRPFPRKKP